MNTMKISYFIFIGMDYLFLLVEIPFESECVKTLDIGIR